MSVQIPLIILAGNDPRPPQLPSGSEDLHPIVGAKAVDLRVGGRPLISWVLERTQASPAFGAVYVGGSRAAFEGVALGGAEMIDTDGSFGENIRTTLVVVVARHPGQPVAFLTCDVLPEPEELTCLMADYGAHAPVDFWFPVVIAPQDEEKLGASAWKPRYRVAHERGGEPHSLLPAHILIVDPAALRLPLLFRAFELAYSTRNQRVLPRLFRMVRSLVASLIGQDIRLLFRGTLPTVTLSVIGNGIALGVRLHRGVMSAEELSERFQKMFVRRRHRKANPDRKGRVFLVDALSLAKDIDTVEEAREMSDALGGRPD